jgi:hypothetical protein
MFKPLGILLGDENPIRSPMYFPKIELAIRK